MNASSSPYSVVSFDVWDTLLRRRCHPDAIKARVAQIFLLTHFTQISPAYRDVFALVKARQQIESEIGKQTKQQGSDHEYGIVAVFERWIERVCGRPPANVTEVAHKLAQAEWEQECQMIYADPDIESIFQRHAAAKKIFISDFYQSATALRGLLDHAGLGQHFVAGYASCDHNLSKASGRLFNHVLQAENIALKTLKHYGDNAHADVAMPGKLGIAAERYLPAAEHAARLQKESIYSQRNLAMKQLQEAGRQVLQGVSGEADIKALALDTALLFIGYALFIQQEAVKAKQEVVFFFTREGEFFKQIYDLLREQDVLGVPVPESALLEVSRVATFGPTLRELSATELMRLWGLYSTQSMRSLFKSLNVPIEAYQGYLEQHHLPLDEPIHEPWQDQRVLALLADEAFKQRLSAQLQADRERLLAYLQQRGLTQELQRIGIVDIGWRGSIQDNLAYLFPTTHMTGYYLGLHEMINEQPINVAKYAFGPDLNRGQGLQYTEVMHFAAPLEMLTNSPNGSTTGYQTINGKVSAVRLIDADENRSFDAFTRHYQAMVLALTPVMAQVIKRNVIQLHEIQPVAWNIWYRVVTKPPKVMADAFFKLNHNETFGLGEFVSKDLNLHPLWFLKLFTESGYRAQFKQFLARIGWIYGYATLHNKPGLVALRKFYHGLGQIKALLKG